MIKNNISFAPEQNRISYYDLMQMPETGYGRIDISKKATLTDLVKENTLFSHAALFTYGNWTHDPVNDFITTVASPCRIFTLTFPDPIFSGLFFREPMGKRTNREWNYKLFGCPNEYWEEFLSFMGTLSGVNYKDQRFHNVIAQRLPIVDYLALEQKRVLTEPAKTVDVHLFGLDGNDRLVCFEPAGNPPIDRIRVKILPPYDTTVELAHKVLSKRDDPQSIAHAIDLTPGDSK